MEKNIEAKERKALKSRIYYLDFLRGFAIIMVVLLHCMSSYITVSEIYGSTSWYIYLVLNAITRTGVPIFIMISGYLILSSEKEEGVWEFYKKRIPRLVIPLVAWNIIYLLYRYFIQGAQVDFKTVLTEFFNVGTYYHMWYLYTLAGIYLFAPFLKMIVKKCTTNQLGVLVAVMVLRSSVIPHINTVFNLQIYMFEPMVNGYLAFFVTGCFLGRLKVTKKLLAVFGVTGVCGFSASVYYSHFESSSAYINLVFNYGSALCHFALAASVFVFAMYFCRDGFLYKIFGSISRVSLGIYLVHVLVLEQIQKYFMPTASPVVCTAYLFVVVFPVSYAVSYIISKIKYVNRIVV